MAERGPGDICADTHWTLQGLPYKLPKLFLSLRDPNKPSKAGPDHSQTDPVMGLSTWSLKASSSDSSAKDHPNPSSLCWLCLGLPGVLRAQILYSLLIVLMHREHASRLGPQGSGMETVTGVGVGSREDLIFRSSQAPVQSCRGCGWLRTLPDTYRLICRDSFSPLMGLKNKAPRVQVF